MIALPDQPLLIGNSQQFLGLSTVEPVSQARSLLADVGDIGDRGRGFGIEDPLAPGFGDQLADRRELNINGVWQRFGTEWAI